jgi:hypothetical protein
VSRRLAIIDGQRAALAYGVPSPDLQARLRVLERENAALRRQLDERPAQPDALANHNRARHAYGERLREAIRAVLASHQGARQMTRKEVLRELLRAGWAPEEVREPSTIGWHIREIRREQASTANAAALTAE